MPSGPEPAFATRLGAYQARAEAVLETCLRQGDPPAARLLEAMRYSVLGGGKRLRPVLVYATGEALGLPLEALDAPAAAVELIHAYSLIHDDLPAMDDDDLRRGKPTCHRAFDEGTAVLAGDALQALAFDVLASPANPAPPALRLQAVVLLARAIGTAGMAGGQAIDLAAVGRAMTLADLEGMHRRKTGALIRASVLLGALHAGVADGLRFAQLARYGEEIGLAFQIQDDILDVTGTTVEIGKQAGADAALGKPTYPALLGLAEARRLADEACARAVALTADLGPGGPLLAELARFMVDRRH
ncbi:MAG: (2E,6E)-farnesyl diphosphate synthase [Pseudomonadota bacterium]